MIRRIILTAFFSAILQCKGTDQNKYMVEKIDSFPLIRNYVLLLKNKHEKIILISKYFVGIPDPQKYKSISCGIILEGIKLKVLNEQENPFVNLFPKSRNGKQAIYIDGKVLIAPEDKFFTSECIEGLFLIKNCNY